MLIDKYQNISGQRRFSGAAEGGAPTAWYGRRVDRGEHGHELPSHESTRGGAA